MPIRIFLSEFTRTLPEKAAQHIRVLRLQPGETIELFDGQGNLAQAKITSIDKKTVYLEILNTESAKAPNTFPIHLGMSLIRNDNMDLVIQKAVELGVTEITPIMAERTQGRFNQEQAAKKLQHWQEIMIASCEQSGNNFLPKLNPICSFNDFVIPAQAGIQLILDPYAQTSLQDLPKKTQSATLLIGPEGGFTNAEVSHAKQAGFQGMKIHNNILRAETAAIIATAVTQMHFGP